MIFYCFSGLYDSFSQELKYEQNRNQILVKVPRGEYHFNVFSEGGVQTTFMASGQNQTLPSHAVLPENERNFSIPNVRVKQETNGILINTKGIRIRIQSQPFGIRYTYKNKLLTEQIGHYAQKDSLMSVAFSLAGKEVLYGGGARVLGMNRRGHKLPLYNKAHYGYETHSEQMNYTMPIVLSSKQYLLHFDNPTIGTLDLDSSQINRLRYEAIPGRKTYQIIAGDSWPGIINSYTNLTGKQPLPPRWALGNFASRFGYHSDREVREVVRRFKKDSIPLDVVVLDIYWFGKTIQGTMGNLEFDRDSFAQPKKLIGDFAKQNLKTILVTEPFILKSSKKWKEAIEHNVITKDTTGNPTTYDFYFGTTGLIDIFEPNAQQWFWNIYKEYVDFGISGWWGDLGEPEVHPSRLRHHTGTADEVHNIYGHEWVKMIYNGYQAKFPKQRPFILMRAGYSGSQRYGLIPWSGDVLRSWGGLQAQPEIALQMGMQGLGYMHSDLGGFAEGEMFDPELYTRWMQYGVFQPIYRPHAQEHIAPEPVFHDKKTKELAKKAIELRYRLLPYNYTLAFENHRTGMPFMRPLLFEDPENDKLQEYSKAYLWGKDILVAPVLEPKQKQQEVYFPKSSNWIDGYTGEKFAGGSSATVTLYEDRIPTFVREGALIPMIPTVQNTEAYTGEVLELHYYVPEKDQESATQVYWDDGKTPEAYKKGTFELLNFQFRRKGSTVEVRLSKEIGKKLESMDRKIKIYVHTRPSDTSTNIFGKTENVSILTIDWKAQQNKVKQVYRLK